MSAQEHDKMKYYKIKLPIYDSTMNLFLFAHMEQVITVKNMRKIFKTLSWKIVFFKL